MLGQIEKRLALRAGESSYATSTFKKILPSMVREDLHPWNVSPREAFVIQHELRKRVIRKGRIGSPRLVGGVDASYLEDGTIVAKAIVVSFPELELLDVEKSRLKVKFPYIPGLLTFREGPAIIEAVLSLTRSPDVVIFDGHGVAHPRSMGIASHVGVLLDIPTIGCAKKNLFGMYAPPAREKGAFSEILDKTGKRIGVALRTRSRVKPVFVSQGHRIRLADAINIVLACCPRYRIPEPLRLAHSIV
ncbi:MAG: deoxyribonuclease V [Candidatus Eisenbacteria bacterium]|nr:deoxyribonuclease V [Candidatus Eisenbacteria bacterium]